MFLIGSLYFVAGSYPHASQFYYAIDRNLTTSAQKPVEKRKIHSYKRKADVVQVKIGSGATAAGSAGIATTSQSMDLRLDITINPIHEEPIKSSAGDRDVGTKVHEIRDRLQSTVVAISKTGTLAKDVKATTSDIEEGSVLNPLLPSSMKESLQAPTVQTPSSIQLETIFEDKNLEDDDAEIEEASLVDITSPLQLVSAAAKAKESKVEPRYG